MTTRDQILLRKTYLSSGELNNKTTNENNKNTTRNVHLTVDWVTETSMCLNLSLNGKN